MIRKGKLYRPCLKCGKMFLPLGTFSRHCPEHSEGKAKKCICGHNKSIHSYKRAKGSHEEPKHCTFFKCKCEKYRTSYFWATKKVTLPVGVNFRTTNGKTISFPVTRTIIKPTRVNFQLHKKDYWFGKKITKPVKIDYQKLWEKSKKEYWAESKMPKARVPFRKGGKKLSAFQ